MVRLTTKHLILAQDPKYSKLYFNLQRRLASPDAYERNVAAALLQGLDKKLEKYDTPILPVHKLKDCKIIPPPSYGGGAWGVPKNNSKNRNKVNYLNKNDVEDICFFCEKKTFLNEEHLPVHASGNTGLVSVITGNNLSQSHCEGVLDFSKFDIIKYGDRSCSFYDNGVVENRLCPKCNSSYNYGTEYTAYVRAVKNALLDCKNKICNLQLPQSSFSGFIKQILSMFLVNCSKQFYTQYRKEVIEYITDRDNKSLWLPNDSKLWFGVYNGPLARRIGVKSIMGNGRAIWYGEVSFSPFIFVLAESGVSFQNLKDIFLLNNNTIQVSRINFKSFDVGTDMGFSWDTGNNSYFESHTNALESLYFRQKF